MNQTRLLLQFWKHEAGATRRVIGRIPEQQSDYRPHRHSRSARELAWPIVLEEKLLVEGLENGVIDWREEELPVTVAAILAVYDRQHEEVVARLEKLEESAWEQEVAFTVAGQEFRRDSGHNYGCEFLFDQIHHRGRLSTYLRPMGAKVPAIIGPSWDEMS